eukprot:2009540-Prymnesium_polylepis.1
MQCFGSRRSRCFGAVRGRLFPRRAPWPQSAHARSVAADREEQHAHSRLRRTARETSRVRVGAAEGNKVQCLIPAS